MVSIIENWAALEGEVLEVRKSAEVPGHVVIAMRVSAAGAVAGFPNLLEGSVGQSIECHVREGAAGMERVQPGGKVSLKARRADRKRTFADPQSIRVEA